MARRGAVSIPRAERGSHPNCNYVYTALLDNNFGTVKFLLARLNRIFPVLSDSGRKSILFLQSGRGAEVLSPRILVPRTSTETRVSSIECIMKGAVVRTQLRTSTKFLKNSLDGAEKTSSLPSGSGGTAVVPKPLQLYHVIR